MPLSALQKKLLSRGSARYSRDIDIFQDSEGILDRTATADAELLKGAGYSVEWLRSGPSIWTANVGDGLDETKLEWVHDSDYRFFPPVPDDEFGYVLHPADIATNKALAAAGRREPRDLVDLSYIHEHILPLGAVIWAAVAKDPGWSPEALIAQIRRNGRYRDDDLGSLKLEHPISAAELSQKMRTALDEAEAFVSQMPSAKAGLLFLESEGLVQPDPSRLERYATHEGRRGGHWPSSSALASAMLRAWEPKRR